MDGSLTFFFLHILVAHSVYKTFFVRNVSDRFLLGKINMDLTK